MVYESVESIEAIPDLQELIRKAGDIIKRYEKSERKTDFYTVPCYPTITTQVWNGDNYIKHKNLVEDFYWGPTDEITMDIGEGFEVALSELPEIEQLEVCQLIINAEEDNL